MSDWLPPRSEVAAALPGPALAAEFRRLLVRVFPEISPDELPGETVAEVADQLERVLAARGVRRG